MPQLESVLLKWQFPSPSAAPAEKSCGYSLSTQQIFRSTCSASHLEQELESDSQKTCPSFGVSSLCVHHHLKYCPWYLLSFNKVYHQCNSLEPWMPNPGILELLPSAVFSRTEFMHHGTGDGGLKIGDYRQGKLLRWNLHLYQDHMDVQCHRIQAWRACIQGILKFKAYLSALFYR